MSSFLDKHFCPGCNAELPADNDGCPDCYYGVSHGEDSEFEHIPSLRWWMETTTIADGERMGDFVGMGFVRRLLMEIRRLEGLTSEGE